MNTHGHWDHIGAVDVLRDALGVQLAIHREDAPMLTASEEEMAVYSVFVGKKKPAEILLEDGDVIAVPNDTTNEARALLLLAQEENFSLFLMEI